MLFKTASELYIADKSERCRMNTVEGYVSAIRCHLMPAWGDAHIEEIRHEGLQAWVDGMPTSGAALADVAVALGHTSVEMCRRHYLLSTRAVVERAGAVYSAAMGAD